MLNYLAYNLYAYTFLRRYYNEYFIADIYYVTFNLYVIHVTPLVRCMMRSTR